MDKVSVEEFEFSLHEREDKIRAILSCGNQDLEASRIISTEDVRRRWARFLEISLMPCPWLALANKSADDSKLVDVVQIDWTQLKATVEVLKDAQENLETFEVSLASLFPLGIEEDKAQIRASSEALDHLRFFLDHLWFPWDEDDDGEDDESGSWIDEHLSLRFLAVECHKNETSDTFTVLKKLARKYCELKLELTDAELEDNLVLSMRLEHHLDNIAKKATIAENTELYEDFLKQRRLEKEQRRAFDIARGYSIDRQAVMVWNGGTQAQLTDFVSRAAQMIPFDDAHVLMKDTLQDAIDCCVPGDVILVNKGEHLVEDFGDLIKCLKIFGVDGRDKTRVIVDSGFGYEAVIRGAGSTWHLENLVLLSKTGQGGIWVKQGASLTLKDCRLTNFSTAIKVSGGGQVVMKWSEIDGCQVGAEVDVNSILSATGGLVEDCLTGFVVESRDLEDISKSGVTLNEVDNYATNKMKIVQPGVQIKITEA